MVDLLRVGQSLHNLGYTLSWVELRAFIKHAPPGSALASLDDDLSAFQSPENMLLRTIGDALLGANWQRSGGRGRRPEPIYTRLQQAVRSARQDQAAPKDAAEIAAIRQALLARKKQSAH